MQTPDTGLNRETWRTGLTHSGETPVISQDDMAVISNTNPANGLNNTFGYRPDDYGNSIETATALTAGANGLRASGVIAQLTDVDFFRITASGTTTITADVDEFVNDLDAELYLYDSTGALLASSDPANSFDASIVMSLTAGTYYVEVRCDGEPGEAGQYQLSVTSPLRTVQGVTVDDGSAQRSRVSSLTVAFSGLVDLPPVPAGAFQLTRIGPGGPTGDVTMLVDLSGSTATQTIAKLTFSGVFTEFGSLIDGNYTLTVLGSQISANGQPLDGDGDGVPGGNFTLSFFRFFGDVNGDRFVNGADFGPFRAAFGTAAGDPGYNAAFDLNGDGFVNGADFGPFRTNFGLFLNP
jgi:hypothetical protein